MEIKQIILELPERQEDFRKILADEQHEVQHVAFSSVLDGGTVRHFVLVVWHDGEYGDHLF
jgi:hypothetical protein